MEQKWWYLLFGAALWIGASHYVPALKQLGDTENLDPVRRRRGRSTTTFRRVGPIEPREGYGNWPGYREVETPIVFPTYEQLRKPWRQMTPEELYTIRTFIEKRIM